MKPIVHLLVDFENLKPSPGDVAGVRAEEYRLWVFHGPHQNKFDAALVKAWQPLGDRVDFVQSAKQGKNALDFHIAFKLGALHRGDTAAARQASYVVVSGDGGFEALFDYMKSLGCTVSRAGSIPEALSLSLPRSSTVVPSADPVPPTTTRQRPARGIIPAVPSPQTKTTTTAPTPPVLRQTHTDGDVETVMAALRAHPKNRPGDRKALERYIVDHLSKSVVPEVARAVIHELVQRKAVTFDGKKINYTVSKVKK